MADAVPVFAVLPAHCLVSHDRTAGARGTPLRPQGVPAAEAAQTGGIRGAVWPAVGRGRAAPGLSPLDTTDGRLCSPGRVARAAEAANPARSPDDPATPGSAAAGALCYGRLALGRSDHAGISQPPGRSRPDGPRPGAVDLSA